METVHYLSVSHVLAVLLIYEDNVVSVLGAHERKVDLVVYEWPVIVEVRVATSMDLSACDRCDLSERYGSHGKNTSIAKH